MYNNITIKEFFSSFTHLFEPFNRYRKTYKNFLNVMFNVINQKYPIHATLKNGQKKILNNYYESYLTTHGIIDSFQIENNLISISKPNLPELTFDLGNNNGDVYSVFFEEAYKFLPVKNQTIIDIGANIADSSIYFAAMGAKKIIALEPLPKNYHIAQINVKKNSFEEKIDLLMNGCSNSNGFLKIDPEKEGAGNVLEHSKNELKIPLKTLENILQEYSFEPTLLKLDCEGCEYDVILSSEKNILQNFSHIQIEYHYGYENLKNKLESCGFNVSVTKPHFIRNRQAGKNMFYGYLYATRTL
jgi:FkbM family methyltransferase